MLLEGLWAPSTFPLHHRGEHWTWKHPGGKTARIDYILLPDKWKSFQISTKVVEEVDITTERTDHRMIMASIHLGLKKPSNHRERPPRPDPFQVRQQAENDTKAGRMVEVQNQFQWEDSVNDSAKWLNDALLDWPDVRCFQKMNKRKTHLQDETWSWISYKKKIWKRIKLQRSCQHLQILRGCFLLWKGAIAAEEAISLVRAEWGLNRCLVQSFQLLWKAAAEVKRRVRLDDAAFYARLAMKAGDAGGLRDYTGLWKILKPCLPSATKRKSSQTRCCGPTNSELRKHFHALEAGRHTPLEDLVNASTEKQRDETADTPLCWQLTNSKAGKQ